MRYAIAVTVLLAAPIAAAARAPALPRMPDGKPNLQGIWQVLNTASWDIQDHAVRLGVPGGPGVVEGNELPYRPEALAKKRPVRMMPTGSGCCQPRSLRTNRLTLLSLVTLFRN